MKRLTSISLAIFLALTAILLSAKTTVAQVMYENNQSYDDYTNVGQGKAQSFVAISNHNITSVTLWLISASDFPGDGTLSIQTVGSNGLPSGTVLGSGTKSLDLIGGGPGGVEVEFTLDSAVDVYAGFQYAIVLEIEEPTSLLKIWLGELYPPDPYKYGTQLTKFGGVWYSYAGLGPDLWFIVRGNDVEVSRDFGDAPDSYGTLSTSSGANHSINTSFYLGSIVDGEVEGLADPMAEGDDNDNYDDGDGISFTSDIMTGETATVDAFLTSPSVNGYLNAWLDFNRNGVWDDGEQIFTNQLLNPGDNVGLSFDVPSDASTGISFARFRLTAYTYSQSYITHQVGPKGDEYGGEVEDYQVEIKTEELPPPPAPPAPPVAVGGEVYPVDKTALLAPWIVLAVVIAAVSVVLMRRRVRV